MSSNMPDCNSFPLAVQLRATPPARARRRKPVLVPKCLQMCSMTRSRHSWRDAATSRCTSNISSFGLRRLALAGGVALNCTANGKLLQSGMFDDIFVQPAAGDDGSALGAAAFRAAQNGGIRNARIPVPFYGPAYSLSQIEQALKEFDGRIEVRSFDSLSDTCAQAARLIADGHVVGWYRGRMEFGPRAL